MNNADELKQRAIEMAALLLERKSYRIIGRLSGECISLVAVDDGDIVFARVVAREANEKGFPAEVMDRKEAEADAIAWFERQGEPIPDSRIRFDEVALVIFDGGKAMIRHHDGIHEMNCPEASCSSVECHAWDTLTSRYHQASDASLNLWILAPIVGAWSRS